MAPISLRDTVLRAAVDYIADHGPDGLSFRQVASVAGVSHQAPYHHFTDRRGIFRAIALEGFAMFAAALHTAEQRADIDQPTALLQGYVDFALEHKGHFRIMFRNDLTGIDEDPVLAAVAEESFDVLIDHVQRALGESASVEHIRDRTVTMWSLAHGLATLLIDGPLESKVGPVSDRHALMRAVAAHSGLAGPRSDQP
jgi:AcrR family transcriptional regulator